MGSFVIVNPASGGGRARSRWPRLSRLLRDAIGPFDHAMTARPGEATAMARAAIEGGCELVVAVGGDGTVNEVVNGFAGAGGQISRKCAFAAVPCGTGSDFVRGLGPGTGAERAIEILAKHGERLIDVGRTDFDAGEGTGGSRLFVNVASFGLSGTICRNMSLAPRSRVLPLRLTFLVETLAALRSFQPVPVRLTIDDTVIERQITLVAVANGRCFGAGMLIAPQADMQDGQFDIIVLKVISKSRLIGNIAKVYSGNHLALPEIEVYRGSRIKAEFVAGKGGPPAYAETDGESAGQLGCTISLLPQALRFAQ